MNPWSCDEKTSERISTICPAATAEQISQVEQSVLENKLWEKKNMPSKVQEL